jgi:hypothetical protein
MIDITQAAPICLSRRTIAIINSKGAAHRLCIAFKVADILSTSVFIKVDAEVPSTEDKCSFCVFE